MARSNYSSVRIRELLPEAKIMARDILTDEVHEWSYIGPFTKEGIDVTAGHWPEFEGAPQERFLMERVSVHGRKHTQGCYNRDISKIL